MLTLEARLRQRASRMRRHKTNDFQLRDVPLSDPYVLSTGSYDNPDPYLDRLREVHGDRERKDS